MDRNTLPQHSFRIDVFWSWIDICSIPSGLFSLTSIVLADVFAVSLCSIMAELIPSQLCHVSCPKLKSPKQTDRQADKQTELTQLTTATPFLKQAHVHDIHADNMMYLGCLVAEFRVPWMPVTRMTEKMTFLGSRVCFGLDPSPRDPITETENGNGT